MSVLHWLRLGGRYAIGIPALRGGDVLLTSFPRSGSTLVRFVVVHYALGLAGDRSTVTFDRLNRQAPELGASGLGRGTLDDRVPRLVKTHRPYSPALARPRALHLVRSPLDALASYHRYWTGRVGGADVGSSEFLRDRRRGLPRWILHTQSWRSRADGTLSYADLRKDPGRTIADAFGALGVEIDRDEMARAAERSSPEAVREQERAGGIAGSDRLGDGASFVADRAAGEGERYFSAEDQEWAHRRLIEAGLGVWSRGGA